MERGGPAKPFYTLQLLHPLLQFAQPGRGQIALAALLYPVCLLKIKFIVVIHQLQYVVGKCLCTIPRIPARHEHIGHRIGQGKRRHQR